MPDLPKMPTVSLTDSMHKTISAANAVREGIASHAQKHAATRSAKHAALEADHKLQQSK